MVSGHPAFILGLGQNGYGIARSLAREHVPVLGFHYSDDHTGRSSRLLRTRALDLRVTPEELAAVLRYEARAFRVTPVLFAASDVTAHLISRSRSQLEEHFAFHWLPSQAVSGAFDKAEMSRLCASAGIRIPRTHATTAEENVAVTAGAFRFPCVVKPMRSFGVPFPAGMKAYVAKSREALIGFYERHPDELGTRIWQELIEGPDDHIYQCNVLIHRSGTVADVCVVRKLRQHPAGYGNMCFGRTETNQTVTDASLRLLRCLNYRGFASVEFKRRESDGYYYFIEMNARLPRYCALFARANVNLPHIGYDDLRSREVKVRAVGQRNHVYWLAAGEDFRSRREPSQRPTASLRRWAQSMAKAPTFAWWNLRDPAPFLRRVINDLAIGHPPADDATDMTKVERWDPGLREAFDREFARPRLVRSGGNAFLVHDISPERLISPVPILFCPGWLQNPENHKDMVYAVYKAGRRIVFADAPHGIHVSRGRDACSAEARKAALHLAVLDAQGILETDAIGHSEGVINLAMAATTAGAPPFRNVLLVSPAGLGGTHGMLTMCYRAWREYRQESNRRSPTERRLLRDASTRRLYFLDTPRDTLAEARAITKLTIWELLGQMRTRGTTIAIVHGVDDKLFPMSEVQSHAVTWRIDGFYSVRGGHQEILVEPSVFGRLASEVLRLLERKRFIDAALAPSS